MRSDRTDLTVESRSTLLTLEQDSAFSRFRLKPSCSSVAGRGFAPAQGALGGGGGRGRRGIGGGAAAAGRRYGGRAAADNGAAGGAGVAHHLGPFDEGHVVA